MGDGHRTAPRRAACCAQSLSPRLSARDAHACTPQSAPNLAHTEASRASCPRTVLDDIQIYGNIILYAFCPRTVSVHTKRHGAARRGRAGPHHGRRTRAAGGAHARGTNWHAHSCCLGCARRRPWLTPSSCARRYGVMLSTQSSSCSGARRAAAHAAWRRVPACWARLCTQHLLRMLRRPAAPPRSRTGPRSLRPPPLPRLHPRPRPRPRRRPLVPPPACPCVPQVWH